MTGKQRICKNWFEIDKNGLKELQAGKPKTFLLRELLQNALDENVASIHLKHEWMKGIAHIEVEDDSPEGFKDLKDAYTLYASCYKRPNPEKRGRYNLGEKQAFAICDEAIIQTTKGTIRFDRHGRYMNGGQKREEGTYVGIKVRMTREEYNEVVEYIDRILPPYNIMLFVQSAGQPPRELRASAIRTFKATLQTEWLQEGAMKRGMRQTEVRLHNMIAGDKPFLYEMGLPVCPLDEDLEYHVNIQQRIPMANDRDTVSESYLKSLYGQLLNEIYTEVETEKASAKWVREATKSSWAKKEAVACIVYKRYGDKVVINTPNNPLANDDALSQGYKVVGGSEMSGEEWDTIKGFDLIQTSAGKFGKLGVAGTYVEPTLDMQNVATLFKRLAQEAVGFAIEIVFVESIATNLAQYGNRTMTINASMLGAAWFKPNNLKAQLSLFVHEVGHEYGLHCDASYHQALTDIGAKLVCKALESSWLFDAEAI